MAGAEQVRENVTIAGMGLNPTKFMNVYARTKDAPPASSST